MPCLWLFCDRVWGNLRAILVQISDRIIGAVHWGLVAGPGIIAGGQVCLGVRNGGMCGEDHDKGWIGSSKDGKAISEIPSIQV
jgi:hypothetical protein